VIVENTSNHVADDETVLLGDMTITQEHHSLRHACPQATRNPPRLPSTKTHSNHTQTITDNPKTITAIQQLKTLMYG
jgi:hypothetical protein